MPKYTELPHAALIDALLVVDDPLMHEAAERLLAAHAEIERLEAALRAAVRREGAE